MLTGFKDIQEFAAEMAKKNGKSAFMLAEKIGKAENIQDILALQAHFARKHLSE